ncbi:hypothetical protein FXO38_30565 [Capsicum annuum]|nr:hypothetical protein FXO38_30565 [Capsicum annuum]
MSSLRPSFCSINQQLTLERLNYTFWERGEIPIEGCWVLGSCHGLILINLDLEVYLWNPATRFCTKVLQLPGVFRNEYFTKCGELCFDSSKNDYKLVMFSCHNLSSPEFGGAFALVASLKDKEGRRIQFHHDIPSVHEGIALQGRLQYRIRCDDKTCVEILVMKEYGVKDSWTSLFFIRNLEIDPSFGVALPFAITENGELALIINRGNSIQKMIVPEMFLTEMRHSLALRMGKA